MQVIYLDLCCYFMIVACYVSCAETQFPKIQNNGVLGEFRIVGGKPANPGEFRGQVSLQNKYFAHICAGTLIDPSHIVTAAHCHQREKPIVYVMGDDLLVTYTGSKTRQRRKVLNFIQHPEFSRDTFQNDIAVIRIEEPFNITNTFGPMRRSVSTPVEGTHCMVVGWGYTQGDEDSDISSTLLKTDVDVIDVNFCNGSYSYAGAMMPGMFCAGNKREGGHDACQGDSGGLLSCVSGEFNGIISFGNECGLSDFPGIYTDVSMFKEWIDEILATNKLPHYEYSPIKGSFKLSDQIDDANGSDRQKSIILIHFIFSLLLKLI